MTFLQKSNGLLGILAGFACLPAHAADDVLMIEPYGQATVISSPMLKAVSANPVNNSPTTGAKPADVTPAMAKLYTANQTLDYKIVAKKLDVARNSLQPATGSSIYTIDQKAIDKLPQGDFTPVSEVLLRAPGVAQDSYGQLRVRGDHGNLQYRINGVILPESIGGFGQTLDTHFAKKIDLLTGALPAQYGYRTAGVVDITAQNGAEQGSGGLSSVMLGSNETLEGNQEFYGTRGRLNYYVTGTYTQNNRGVEPPTSSNNPIHDDTTQDKEFAYASYVLNPRQRLSFIFGNANNRFEIPNNPSQPENFTLNGVGGFASASLDQKQFERNRYGIVALQGAVGSKTDYQVSLFSRYSNILYKPDAVGDLIFNGIAARTERESFTNGIQTDASYRLNSNHTLRSGLFYSYENADSDSRSAVFPTDMNGVQSSDVPFDITDNHRKGASLAGIYVQDEWHAARKLTINYGARFDDYRAYVNENQLSPRLGAVYDLTANTKLHAGYARYFTPPPTELIAPVSIMKFDGTTGALASAETGPVKAERAHYFDMGVVQKVGPHLTLGVDGYYKLVRNILDEGQFGQALIYSPFNYEQGRVRGVEFTADYQRGAFTGFANLALSKGEGKKAISGQFNFEPDELVYIADHYVHLDHDQTLTGSAGVSYTHRQVNYSADVLYGSGLRSGFVNSDHLPGYTQVNLGVAHSFDLGANGSLDSKISVINLFDKIYQIRDGSGIGVFGPQYGPRRGVYFTLSRPF